MWTLVVSERDAEAMFGKKLRIVLEKVDMVREGNLSSKIQYKSQGPCVNLSSSADNKKTSPTSNISAFNLLSEFTIKTEEELTNEEHSEITGHSANQQEQAINLTNYNKTDEKEIELGSIRLLSVSVKSEEDWNQPEAMFESPSNISVNLRNQEANCKTNGYNENKNVSLVSQYLTINPFCDKSIKQEAKLSPEDDIGSAVEFEEDTICLETNENIKPMKDSESKNSISICLNGKLQSKVDELGPIIKVDLSRNFSASQQERNGKNGKETIASSFCSAGFAQRVQLSTPVRTRSGRMMYARARADYNAKFSGEGFLKNHIKTPISEKPFACAHCNSTFSRKGTLKLHIRTHTGEKPFQCTHCSSTFSDNTTLKHHIRTHTGEKSFQCRHCNIQLSGKRSLNDHIMTHTGEKRFQCAHCKAKFFVKRRLIYHIMTHTSEKAFECTHCNAKFFRRFCLQQHIRTHTGDKPFQCTHCNAKFHNKSNLRNHIRTHTGEKPFECTHCSAKFSQKGTLKYHVRTHTGEKPFECTRCNAKFSSNHHLKRHMRTHTGEKPFECAHCNAKFSQKGALKVHIKGHSGEKPFECSLCN